MRTRWNDLTARAAVAAAVLCTNGCSDDDTDALARDPLDSTVIPKFVEPLVIPPAMEPIASGPDGTAYRIAVRQFPQQVLPSAFPTTVVWGYGRDGDPSSFRYPGATIEARSNEPIRVTWVNELTDATNRYLPPLLPVDATIHVASPGGHDHGATPHQQPGALYTGPVPIVTHLHGGHSFDHSDGHPDAWFLPNAINIPEGFATVGPTYRSQADAGPGTAVFDYPLDEPAQTLWYHDHTLGMTRVNIYSGLAGFLLIRDAVEDGLNLPGPAPQLGDPSGNRYFEIPLAISDKSFTEEGALWYPSSRTQFDGYDGPFKPDSDVAPIWGPEFIGNAIVVNGKTWPFHEVEPRLYRFRILNSSDARTFIFRFDRPGLQFVQIGGDGGRMFDAPVPESEIVLGSAERADVLVDFSALAPGETVTLLNVGPDEPWSGPDAGQAPANPQTTGQVMQFRIIPSTNLGNAGAIPATLPPREVLTATAPDRDLLLQELTTADDFPTHVMLGTVAMGPLPWTAPATEVVRLNDTEIWRVANTTDDAHPIHVHLVAFQIVDRIPFDVEAFKAAQDKWAAGNAPPPVLDDFITGPPMPIAPGEAVQKDTVMMLPGTITRIIARFDRAGSYVWHCHIVEHEDNEMMRPLVIMPSTTGP
jgi:FtsP/CotA-like multicopper oxidase with cupredoxin domain